MKINLLKKELLICVILMTTLSGFAQNATIQKNFKSFTLGYKGLSIGGDYKGSYLYGKKDKSSSLFYLGFSGIHKFYEWGLELGYAYENTTTTVNTTVETTDRSALYFSMPFHFQYCIQANDKFGLFIHTGPNMNLYVSLDGKDNGSGTNFDFSWGVGAGFQIGKVRLGAGASWGLVNVASEDSGIKSYINSPFYVSISFLGRR